MVSKLLLTGFASSASSGSQCSSYNTSLLPLVFFHTTFQCCFFWVCLGWRFLHTWYFLFCHSHLHPVWFSLSVHFSVLLLQHTHTHRPAQIPNLVIFMFIFPSCPLKGLFQLIFCASDIWSAAVSELWSSSCPLIVFLSAKPNGSAKNNSDVKGH